ncbi:MAG: hypothetical protein M3Z17_11125 [Gemmatimonadota bacterium]|nr:hypothetical protein [Gemmatimonadota bacterium]
MNRIGASTLLPLIALTLLSVACKPRQAALTKPPPQQPPGGFKNAKQIQRKGDDDSDIWVEMALGDNAVVVNSSTAPSSDVALGWITNQGTKKEKVYKFQPSDQADYFLYAVSSTPGGWRIAEVKKNGSTKDNWMTGTFAVCDTHVSSTSPDIGFKSCTGGAPMQSSHASMTDGFLIGLFHRIFGGPHPFDDPSAPGWSACTDGCCTWSAN